MNVSPRLSNFPVSFFSVVLGLAGYTIAAQKLAPLLGMSSVVPGVLLAVSVAVFVLVSFVYIGKVLWNREAVKREFSHPIRINFFPTISISLLLFSIAFLSQSPVISLYLWIAGALLHLLFTVTIVKTWMQSTQFTITHMNPSWFIPAVGNIIVPLAGVVHAPIDISWFFYSIGLLFWVVLLVVFFNRIIFHSPLPEKLLPTLFILIAPPAVGFIATVSLLGEIAPLAKVLYFFACFLVLLLLFQLNMFRAIQYYLSWWAYTFPLAAFTIASLLMFAETNSDVYLLIGTISFVGLSALIVLLAFKTITAIARKEICIEE